jgi:hypothetical protein
MHPETDDAAIQADAYIDALLAGHGRVPVAIESEPEVRDAIRLLEKGLPRFHPSFVFEEWLSGQIQRASAAPNNEDGGDRGPAEIVPIVFRTAETDPRAPDRRLLVGGAIASGVSIAGAAVLAWRRTRHVPGNAD